MGRLPVTATGKLAHSLRTSERLKSAEFLAIEGRLATLDPHNKCNDLLNLITRRSPVNDNLVNIYTEYEDIVRIGDEIEELYNNVTCAVLDEYGVVVNDAGKVEDHSSIDSQTCEITAPYLVYSSIVSEVDGLSTEEADLWNYVNDYNENKDPAYQIHGTFWFETDPASTCYICVDDVLVHRQNRTKLVHKNGKWVSRTILGDGIFHSVGYIEHNGLIYILEAPSQEKLYARILAFLLKNNLQDKYLIFFTDGEEALKAEANRVFEMWPHKLYLDYYHLKENLEGRFSRIFKAGKIVDDRSKVEYFKNGNVKKSSLQRITRSQYHLRAIIGMLWAGNVNAAINYLLDLKGTNEVKQGGDAEIDKAIKYLRDKMDRIPCYVLREYLNLRNTSNSVEIANNILVARRQKKKGIAWSDDGSFTVSGIMVVFENGDVEELFTKHTISFGLRKRTMDRGRRTGLEWIVDSAVEIHVKRELKQFEDAA